ncbi:MAG: carboxypeptidase-like regulatory domain-containing protein [Candidatus Acidiferrales bacterium]
MNTQRRQLEIMTLLLAFFTMSSVAQDNKRETQLRTVHGVVIDKSETPIPAGVVFLKNTRTNAVRSYIADDAGNYRFSGLDPNADYEIHAEKDGAKSQTRTVSSFDSRKDIVINLKIDKKKA